MNNFLRKTILFVIPIVVLLILFPVAHAQFSDVSEINKKTDSIVHYAEEYEIGNINYLQLNVHGHKTRADLNLMLGGGVGPEWGRIPQESIEKAFGPPTDYTNWAWVENKHMDKRFDEPMPLWERIVFDGKKVQIKFHAFPQIIEGENGEIFKFYSVDLNVRFKKKFQFDTDSILNELKILITDYNLARTRESGEILVRKMLEYERLLGNYIQQNLENCMKIVGSFFTPEEQWPEEKMVRWEFSLYNSKDFDVKANFDMCEECEWHWVYMGFWVEGRGPIQIFESPELNLGKLKQQIDEQYYWSLPIDELNKELKKTVFEIRDDAEKFDKTRSEDFPKKFFFNRFKIETINRILDGKYNNVHEFDKSIARRIELGEIEGLGGCDSWKSCKRYCEKFENMDECRQFTYNLRVKFLTNMFEGYDITITPVNQIEWERRLFENFETKQDSWCRHVNDFQCAEDEGCVNGKCVLAIGGNEICNNGMDDDGDNVVDCQDPDCYKERHCGKLCEKTCNVENGCWQTIHNLCSGVCKECWDCGGDEKCKEICEPVCWPCHNQEEIQSACEDCWTCEDEAYGGCYVKCKPCTECNNRRMKIIQEIFERAISGEIETPGGCTSEEECNIYCIQHGKECGELMSKIGLWSEELDCGDECKECTICNYDQGSFNCNINQHFDRDNGYCTCNEGFYDCDGNWKNGCESEKPCWTGPCYDECKNCNPCLDEKKCEEVFNGCMEGCINQGSPECQQCFRDCLGTGRNCGVECGDVCSDVIPCVNSCERQRRDCEKSCDNVCLDCNKCRNPDMPTYICDGVEQLEPCEPEFICNGVKQEKPCTIYICNGRDYTKPCDEINITCGKNQILLEEKCECEKGFKDCDSDGNCEPTMSCGMEICNDNKDNNNNGLVDCQDTQCNEQVCGFDEIGNKMYCINKQCIPPEEKPVTPPELIICGNHICEEGENEENCPKDCIVCPIFKPPGCPNGKIVWKGKDENGCQLPPICVVTEKECEVNEDCPQPDCGVSQCIDGGCKVTELVTECKKVCEEGRTKTRECEDGSEIVTAVCSANEWVNTGYDCPEVPKELPPEEKPVTPPEEVTPEVEEETLEVRGECTLATDCGGPQDVCSNGNCVTLPLPVEEVAPTPEVPTEVPAEQPAESPPESTPEEKTPAPEIPTGGFIEVLSKLGTDWFVKFTGLFAGEKQSCEDQCKPCENCNRKVDDLMKKIQSGEIKGPGGCKNRGGCEEYCRRIEHLDECKNFYKEQNLETIDCWWEFCRHCDTCKYDIGEFQCNENQQFNRDEGYCECVEGFYDCDGDWENGCESPVKCGVCESKEDCAKDRCAPWGNVIQQFDCFKGEEWTHEVGAFKFGGMCRFFPTKRIEGSVFFDGWGNPFEELRPIKEEIQEELGKEWCEYEIENAITERVEIQSSLTEDFLKWFFEDYVPSSPSEWEKHIGGIYDSYWRIVNNNRWTTERLLCLGSDKWPEEFKKIDVSYDTEYGSVRIWEEETTTNFFGKRMKIFSPYMQIWVFPTKEFLKKEFQSAMESGLMPSPEGKKKPESSLSEIEEMKKDKKLMDLINSLSSKYGGEAKFLMSIVDSEEVVFNALITVGPDILIKFDPMKEYTGDYDAKIIIDFNFFYNLILTTERDMRGGDIVYPPWETGVKFRDMIRGFIDGIKMWYTITSGINAGKIKAEPSNALSDGLELLRLMFERGPG